MKCPRCKGRTKTLWVRHKDKFTLRRRECTKCKYGFSTKEMISDDWNYKNKYESVVKKLKKILEDE